MAWGLHRVKGSFPNQTERERVIPNIYESPSESLNFQLQKLGFCGRKELKPLRAAGEKKKLNQLSHQHFQAAGELLGSSKWKVGWSCGEGERGSQSENGNWGQSQLKGSDRTPGQAGLLSPPGARRSSATLDPQINLFL